MHFGCILFVSMICKQIEVPNVNLGPLRSTSDALMGNLFVSHVNKASTHHNAHKLLKMQKCQGKGGENAKNED